ncbi:hypothetical protein T11_5816 [Trichinella zimbabwensis]|uniref:Uncharacterized protein n=1 Tax=Trichinella zimbabwensis TaxID=268475 RepID=A0A0V1H4T2_9BILA|nr:hypothetical protein T11_5816 [Trichinella zimbabwensis]
MYTFPSFPNFSTLPSKISPGNGPMFISGCGGMGRRLLAAKLILLMPARRQKSDVREKAMRNVERTILDKIQLHSSHNKSGQHLEKCIEIQLKIMLIFKKNSSIEFSKL